MTNSPILLDGKRVSQEVLNSVAERVARLKAKTGVQACLATVLVGEDPASATYVGMKVKRCAAVGIKSIRVDIPGDVTTGHLVHEIQKLANDPNVHGILLQHPVPHQIDERAAFEAIGGAKDVDGVTIHSFGAMSFDLKGFGSCTPAGIMRLLEAYKVPLKGKHAVVIGRSAILGKPMAMMLLAKDATVTICHSKTVDLPGLVRQADIVVAAVGRAEFVKGDWIKPGAVVVDAGYSENKGDVDYAGASAKASMITPVPGGVGPMTIAMLLEQTVIAAGRQLGVEA